MLQTLYYQNIPTATFTFRPHYYQLSRTQCANDDGTVTSKNQYVKYDVAERLAPFKSSDFNIKNIMAMGATHMLRPIKCHVNDVDSVVQFAETFENQLNHAEEISTK